MYSHRLLTTRRLSITVGLMAITSTATATATATATVTVTVIAMATDTMGITVMRHQFITGAERSLGQIGVSHLVVNKRRRRCWALLAQRHRRPFHAADRRTDSQNQI